MASLLITNSLENRAKHILTVHSVDGAFPEYVRKLARGAVAGCRAKNSACVLPYSVPSDPFPAVLFSKRWPSFGEADTCALTRSCALTESKKLRLFRSTYEPYDEAVPSRATYNCERLSSLTLETCSFQLSLTRETSMMSGKETVSL